MESFFIKKISIQFHLMIRIYALFFSLTIFFDRAMAIPYDRRSSIGSLYSVPYEDSLKYFVRPKCGGTLTASLNATALDIPHVENPRQVVYCEWTIKTPHPSLRIGLAAVEITLNFPITETFKIHVYDGSSAKDKRLWLRSENRSLHFFKFEPLTSSTDVVFINYTAIGGPQSIDMKFIYYLCGGFIQTDMEIASPLFNGKTTYDVPEFLQCTWVIEKPVNAYFGYIHFHNLNVPHCDVLSISTIGGDLVSLERDLSASSTAYNNSESRLMEEDEFALHREVMRSHVLARSMLAQRDVTVPTPEPLNNTALNGTQAQNKTFVLKTHRMLVCNQSVRAVAFGGERAVLKFTMFFPERRYGFNAAFVAVRKPKERTVKESPWYFNYAPIAIYCPIGIIFGLLIIYFQRKRRTPATVTVIHPRKKHRGSSQYSQSFSDEQSVSIPTLTAKSVTKSQEKSENNDSERNGVNIVQSNHSSLTSSSSMSETRCIVISKVNGKSSSANTCKVSNTAHNSGKMLNVKLKLNKTHLSSIKETNELLSDSKDEAVLSLAVHQDNSHNFDSSQHHSHNRKSVSFESALVG